MNTKQKLVVVVLVVMLMAVSLACGGGDGGKTLVETGTETREALDEADSALNEVSDTVHEATANLVGCSGKNGHIDRRFNDEITTAELEAAGCNNVEAFQAWCDRTSGGADFGDMGVSVCTGLPQQ